MSEEPNYKDSQKIIGQLYPVLKSKDGQIIDGFHRLAVDPNWKSLILEDVDNEEKLLVARAVSNWHRRQVSREEKSEWINGLAELYQKQGLSAAKLVCGKIINEIKQKIIDVTGLSDQTIRVLLQDKFKQAATHIEEKPKISATERVENILGKNVVERLREEIKAEEKLSPEEKVKQEEERKIKKVEKEKKKTEQKIKKEERQKQLEEKIKKDLNEVKQELSKDPNLQFNFKGMSEHERKILFSSEHDDWTTPSDKYKELDDEFHFDFDPCPLKSDFDGLTIDWKERNFINPPYSNIVEFLKKGHQELDNNHANLLVYLIPVRTDTNWFHTYVYPYFKKNQCEIRFIKGRIKFSNGTGATSSAPFPSMIVIFDRRKYGSGKTS
jgi:hypothetical protein